MTSSLVGSEMCIRDRVNAAMKKVEEKAFAPFVILACSWSPPRVCCSRAVSYTHLTLPTICSV
eukprot:7280652-Prorocentrum_lima.AAC.1